MVNLTPRYDADQCRRRNRGSLDGGGGRNLLKLRRQLEDQALAKPASSASIIQSHVKNVSDKPNGRRHALSCGFRKRENIP